MNEATARPREAASPPLAEPSAWREISLQVNGEQVHAHVESRLLLSDFIRHRLDLTGTHVGCEQGSCGACTILLDGEAARSCLMFAVQADGSTVTTVEGLASDEEPLNGLQQAFHDSHGLQCGFCTPGFLMSATALIESDEAVDAERIDEQLDGNLCRCTGYQGIKDAVARALTPGEGGAS